METISKWKHRPTRFFDGFLGMDPMEDFSISRTGLSVPATNVSENERQWKIEIGAPGLCSEDYKVNIHNNMLHVESTKKMNTPEEEMTYSHREFKYENFSKTFSLPEGADLSNVSASCRDGLLNIIIPKKEEYTSREPRTIAIE